MKKKSLKISVLFITIIVFLSIFLVEHKNQKPIVSVVMPTYNRASFLKRSIESILDQTFSDFEFIIVDDGSNDNTQEILNYYVKKDKRIRILRNNTNKGISYSRNRGLDAAKGKYIAVMDSDDMSYPWRLKRSVDFLERNPDITGVSGIYDWHFNGASYKKSDEIISADEMYMEMLFVCIFSPTISLIRLDFLRNNHIRYNEDMISAEDYDLYAQILLKNGKLVKLKEPLGAVRYHRTNSALYYSEMKKNAISVQYKLIYSLNPEIDIKIKQHYSKLERCVILNKIRNKGFSNKIAFDSFNNIYKKYCPDNPEKSYEVKKPFVQTFFEPINDEEYIFKNTGEKVFVDKISETEMKVVWSNKQKEYFILEDNIWIKKPDYIININYPIERHDKFFIYKDNTGCLVKEKYCAEVLSFTPGKQILVQWKGYGKELLSYDIKNDEYIFVKSFL